MGDSDPTYHLFISLTQLSEFSKRQLDKMASSLKNHQFQDNLQTP